MLQVNYTVKKINLCNIQSERADYRLLIENNNNNKKMQCHLVIEFREYI